MLNKPGSIDSSKSSVRGDLLLIQKDSVTRVHGFAVWTPKLIQSGLCQVFLKIIAWNLSEGWRVLGVSAPQNDPGMRFLSFLGNRSVTCF